MPASSPALFAVSQSSFAFAIASCAAFAAELPAAASLAIILSTSIPVVTFVEVVGTDAGTAETAFEILDAADDIIEDIVDFVVLVAVPIKNVPLAELFEVELSDLIIGDELEFELKFELELFDEPAELLSDP